MDEDNVNFGDKRDRSAKVGRRAKRMDTTSTMDMAETIEDTITQDDMPNSKTTRDSDAPQRPSRRKGGWGEEKRRTMEELDDKDTSSVMPAFGNDDDDLDAFGDRFQSRDVNEESDDEPDIPVIPELEDAHEEDLTTQVAMAPNVVVNRVATYRELDNDLLRHAQFLTLDNEIDLKLLSKGLSAEQDIFEEDAPWDWERLFTEVTSELLTEWEKGEIKEQEEAVA